MVQKTPEFGTTENKKIVLVVEDTKEVMELIVDILSMRPDYKVVAVYDGSQALETIKSVPVGLILLDVKLPGMNGFQIYDALKADHSTSHIPVIFMPATRFEKEFQARGITDPLIKPFDVDEMLARIDQAIGRE